MLIWSPGPGEWVVILIIVLLFAGKSRLPELAKSLGSGINEFKKGLRGDITTAENDTVHYEPEPVRKKVSAPAGEKKPRAKASQAKSSKKA